MKCKQSRPGFELWLQRQFPTLRLASRFYWMELVHPRLERRSSASFFLFSFFFFFFFFFKTSDKLSDINYRRTSLIDIAAKIYATILSKRFQNQRYFMHVGQICADFVLIEDVLIRYSYHVGCFWTLLVVPAKGPCLLHRFCHYFWFNRLWNSWVGMHADGMPLKYLNCYIPGMTRQITTLIYNNINSFIWNLVMVLFIRERETEDCYS